MTNINSKKRQKQVDAFFIFYESVLKPDHELRQHAHEEGCYDELLEWRQDILNYLNTRRYEFTESNKF